MFSFMVGRPWAGVCIPRAEPWPCLTRTREMHLPLNTKICSYIRK